MQDFNYNTHHDKKIDTTKMEFVDTVKASFTQLVAAFGKPIDLKWTIEFANGIVATIYQFHKDEKVFGWCQEETDRWFVTGNTNEAVEHVNYHVGLADHHGIE